ncbi:MAG: DUF2157 domain-containing protein [Phycisphaerales bacterium]|nr:DUF2157 domain-containing protein [Phycisphaerales bacterium]MBT7171654.1 DUF2157 domain-containing protein [Phycisphaerales bacterium]
MNKVSKSNLTWFESEVPTLIEQGCVEPSTAEGMLSHFRARLDDGAAARTVFVTIISALGGVFLMAGIILLLGHNWDMLPKAVRLGCSTAPLVIAQLLGAYVLWKAKGVAWREPVATAMPIALLAAIALVAQVYQITGDGRTTFLVTATLTLPVIYLFRSVGAFVVYMTLMTVFGFACLDLRDPSASQVAPYWLLWLGALPFVFLRLRRGGVATYGGYWIRVAVGIALMFGLGLGFGFEHLDSDSIILLFALLFCALYSLGRFAGEGECHPRLRVWLMMGQIVPVICLAISVVEMHPPSWEVGELIVMTLFCSMCGAVWLAGLLHARRLGDIEWGINSSVFLLVLIAMVVPHFALFGLLALGGFHLARGVGTMSFAQMNWGVVLVATGLVIEVFNYDVDFVVRGLILILIGLGFFAMNGLMLKRVRSEKGAL